jgi:hypothetical protein
VVDGGEFAKGAGERVGCDGWWHGGLSVMQERGQEAIYTAEVAPVE